MLTAVAAVLAVSACGDEAEKGGSTEPASSDTATAGSADPETSSDGDGTPESSTDPYRVAVVADLSGGLAPIVGLDGLAYFQAAVSTVNAEGGVGGHPIEVSVHDSLSTPDGAGAAVRAAVGEDPDAIFLAMMTSQMAPVRPILAQAQLPTLSVLHTVEDMYPTTPWFYAFGSTQPQSATYLIEGARQALGVESLSGARIAFAGIVSTTVDSIFNEATARLEEEGAIVVGDERRPPDGTTFASQAQSLVDADPDVVLVSDGGTGPTLIADGLSTAGYENPIIFMEGNAASTEFLASQQNEDIWGARLYNVLEDAPAVAEAMEAAGEEATGFQPSGWAAAYALAAAFEACGFPCASEGLIGALDGLAAFEPPGGVAIGPMAFSPSKHYGINVAQMYHWSADEAAVVAVGEPIDISATGDPVVR